MSGRALAEALDLARILGEGDGLRVGGEREREREKGGR